MRLSILTLAAVSLCTAAHLQAQDQTDRSDENWKAVCKSAQATPLLIEPPAGPLSASQLPSCDEQALYYGPGGKPNYAAALQCGWWQRAHPRPTVGDMFYGPGVLTMLYANGRGVERNYDLAIRFACENDWAAPAEQASRIGHIEYLRTTHADSGNFDLCDDITSGLSMGACQAVTSDKVKTARDRKIAVEVSTLPAAAKLLLPSLQKAEQAFEQSRTRNEIDLSGTARGMFAQQEEDKLSDQFLINLQRFHKRDVPATSAAELAKLDTKLNATYQQLQHAPAKSWEFGTIKPEGIRDTERAWLKLADAWVSFSRAAYPDLPQTTVRAQLIRLRTHQLQSLLSLSKGC
ncbi:lysozyme inhibitor LprI family protein [Terriglobus roseus]|uniref:Lysozyme inhibitor LprI-like N-terminal domain-containing protein n=1 Tax=Terriglobus roseus TaxID=392734 RepID=A0A1H4LF88_9BACT|nr:lysozyme inhibitor LprI family protein [Terriglobus roseus]SEB69206.1 hypothetical protein SAMN05443244_1572 [Terriglobus roseus]